MGGDGGDSSIFSKSVCLLLSFEKTNTTAMTSITMTRVISIGVNITSKLTLRGWEGRGVAWEVAAGDGRGVDSDVWCITFCEES